LLSLPIAFFYVVAS